MNALALTLLLALQQAPSAQAPSPLLPGGRPPANTHDSTVRTIAAIGRRVAEVKSALGQFRRAAFNSQDPQVVSWGDTLGRRCQQLKDQIRAARCETSLRQLRRDSVAATARNMRREVRNVGNRIIAAISPYEAQLVRVRDAFGWSARGAPAPRSRRG